MMASKLLQQGSQKQGGKKPGGLEKAGDRADPADAATGLVPLPRAAHEGTPTERLAALEDIIGKAQDTAELTVRQAQEQFNRTAAPALAVIYDDELWQDTYKSFVDYVERRWGYSSTHGYLMVATVKVREALPEGASPNTGHVQVLQPVLRHHGTDAVRKSWAQSEKKNGQPTAATLKTSVDALGYGKPVQGEVLKREDQGEAQLPSAVGKMENALEMAKRHLTRTLVKQATEEDPDEARRLAEEFTAWAKKVTRPAEQK